MVLIDVEKSYISQIVEEDTKINKLLVENILRSLRIRDSVLIPHPINVKDELSLAQFVGACEVTLSNGYADETCRALLGAYKFLMLHMDNVLVPRAKEVFRGNLGVAIKRRNLIRELFKEVSLLRVENKGLWEVCGKMEDKISDLSSSLSELKGAFSAFRSSGLADVWKKAFKSSVNNAFESFLIAIEGDLKTLSTRYNVEANIDKLVLAHNELLGLKDEAGLVRASRLEVESVDEGEEVVESLVEPDRDFVDRPPEDFTRERVERKLVDEGEEFEVDDLIGGA